jgi:adenylate kinase
MSMRRIIVITGVPGVGKSTIAKILKERLGCPLIDISDLARKEELIQEIDEHRGTEIVDMERLIERAHELIVNMEGRVLIEGHYAYDAAPADLVYRAFVLRRAPWVLKKELEARGYPQVKVMENLEAELLDICLVEALEALGPKVVCEVDTTGRKIGEVVEEIIAISKGEEPCRIGLVDWLECPQTRKLLEG